MTAASATVTTDPAAPPEQRLAQAIVAEVLPHTPAVTSIERTLTRSRLEDTTAVPLWIAILRHTEAIGSRRYIAFMDAVFGGGTDGAAARTAIANGLGVRPGVDAYQLLKVATEVFLLREVGVYGTSARGGTLGGTPSILRDGDEDATYFQVPKTIGDGLSDPSTQVRADVPLPDDFDASDGLGPGIREYLVGLDTYLDVIQSQIARLGADTPSTADSPFAMLNAPIGLPCLMELIWSYWIEESMLTQTTSAIALRFQNVRRRGGGPDPLADLELDPLRPLSNMLWGFVNDETNRLSLVRRAYEYDHHYGLPLYGRAVRGLRPADSRSRFLDAFHNLLRLTAQFYAQDDDKTVVADAFPVLNGLKELHLVLAEGAHNQFRDLPWTARAEMLVQQWLLARPEMREFLRGRLMVPYPEPWMGTVDSMKRLQGWTDTPVTHFRDLAVFGERLLLSVRHTDFVNADDQELAKGWARYWRQEVHGYVHAYRAATGVDLTNAERVDSVPPAVHLERRLRRQRAIQSRSASITAATIEREALWVTPQEMFPLLPQRTDLR